MKYFSPRTGPFYPKIYGADCERLSSAVFFIYFKRVEHGKIDLILRLSENKVEF